MGNACNDQKIKNKQPFPLTFEPPTDMEDDDDNMSIVPIQTIQPKFFNFKQLPDNTPPNIEIHAESERMISGFTDFQGAQPRSLRSIQKPLQQVKGILKERTPYKRPYSQKSIKSVHFDNDREERELNSHSYINLSKILTQQKKLTPCPALVFTTNQ